MILKMLFEHIGRTAQFILCQKLKILKLPLKNLNEKHYSHISSRAKNDIDFLDVVQQELNGQPYITELQNTVANLRKKVAYLSEIERDFYFKKAKCTYIKKVY